MIMEKILAVDLDAVLADVQTVYVDIVRKEHGHDVSYEDIDNWDFWFNLLGPKVAWEIFKRIWVERANDVNLFDPNAPNALYKAIGMGYQVSIITATQKECIPNVSKWLDAHKVPYKSIIGLFNGQSKYDYPWDAIIDDSPKFAEMAKTHNNGKPIKIFLLSQPWNRSVKNQIPIRVENFDQMLQELE